MSWKSSEEATYKHRSGAVSVFWNVFLFNESEKTVKDSDGLHSTGFLSIQLSFGLILIEPETFTGINK